MKHLGTKVFLAFILAGIMSVPIYRTLADNYVPAHFNLNGTYVPGYYRSDSDSIPYNNYSYPGNINPYTGVTASGNVGTYLKNYYGNSLYTGVSTKWTSENMYHLCKKKSDGTYEWCTCDLGKVTVSGSCVDARNACVQKSGFSTMYDSTDNTCKCDPGYILDGNKKCVYDIREKIEPTVSQDEDTPKPKKPITIGYDDQCPKYSSESNNNASICYCKDGYSRSKDTKSCIKTESKNMCVDLYGKYSKWDGEKVRKGKPLNCLCQRGYEFNTSHSACVVKVKK